MTSVGGAFGPPYRLLVPLVAFAVTLAVLLVGQSGGGADVPSPSIGADLGAPRAGGASIEQLQQTLRDEPSNAVAYTALGELYLQRARETADPAFYSRAEDAFGNARRLEPADAGPVTGLGTLALAKHDFRAALELGLEARRLAPDSPRPLAVLADAQVELGRHEAAARTLERMIGLKPNLASYARVSYFRELQGDLSGAAEAMELAVSAGSGTRENVAYVQTLLGNLELSRGRIGSARAAYRNALAGLPSYLPAEAGLARVDAARGDLDGAIGRYRRVVARFPLLEYAVALAEVELAAGRSEAARGNLELVRAQATLLRSAGVDVDVEIAIFEADHGSATEAVRLGRQALAAAPGVRSEDALGWALTRAGQPKRGLEHARRALRLGTRDASFLYHGGMAARLAGNDRLARRWLGLALEHRAALSPYHVRLARKALRR